MPQKQSSGSKFDLLTINHIPAKLERLKLIFFCCSILFRYFCCWSSKRIECGELNKCCVCVCASTGHFAVYAFFCVYRLSEVTWLFVFSKCCCMFPLFTSIILVRWWFCVYTPIATPKCTFPWLAHTHTSAMHVHFFRIHSSFKERTFCARTYSSILEQEKNRHCRCLMRHLFSWMETIEMYTGFQSHMKQRCASIQSKVIIEEILPLSLFACLPLWIATIRFIALWTIPKREKKQTEYKYNKCLRMENCELNAQTKANEPAHRMRD